MESLAHRQMMKNIVATFCVLWAASSEAAVAITFLQSANSTSDLTTYTFSAQNLGTAMSC